MKGLKNKIPHFTVVFKNSSGEDDVYQVDKRGIIISGGKNKERKRAPKRNLNEEIRQLSKEKGIVIDDNTNNNLNIHKQKVTNDNSKQFYDVAHVNPFITYNNVPGIFVPICPNPQVIFSGHPFVYNQIPTPQILITNMPMPMPNSNNGNNGNNSNKSNEVHKSE